MIQVEASGGDTASLQQVEELSTSAPDVEDTLGSIEVGQVALESLANRGLRSSKLIFEADVFVSVEAGTERGACLLRRGFDPP